MLRITILGCGTSAGVPVPAYGWGICDPNEPRNNRTRCSILIEKNNTKILVDTTPDCRQQLIHAGVDYLDAIIYTHTHADHCHGIDDVRWICQKMQKDIATYAFETHLQELQTRFGYAFEPLPVSQEKRFFNRPILTPYIVSEPFVINDVNIIPFVQDHGRTVTMGIRIDDFAYSTDVVYLNDNAFNTLENIEYWVVDALQYRPYYSHAHLDLTLSWIKKLQPKKSWLTHMNMSMDYMTLIKELPKNIYPAYDGLVIKIEK